MVQELLSRVKNSNLHIAFVFLLMSFSIGDNEFAQSVLLPTDIVIVSVNSSDDSFDFIPLVKLEKGTTFWFSNGRWNGTASGITGDEIEVIVLEPIDAGTNIHINKIQDPKVEIKGHLEFSEEGNRIFVYQKDEGIIRFIYGIGWGNTDVWNPNSEKGSEIPISISKDKKSLIQLGLEKNYQYYLRNGASGTPAMLVSFVGDPANWRGKSSTVFSSFQTAFRILKPPVILFNESISTIKEGEPLALNVAIYEHDGSKLTIDAVFGESISTADTNDVKNFSKHTFNFTGLIGDAIYAIEIPTFDDDQFEGTERALFELENLSKGSLGDFVSHVAFISDNEVPNVQISVISYSNNWATDFIEVQNTERFRVHLSGWKLTSRGFKYEFEDSDYLEPYQKLKIFHPNKDGKESSKTGWISRNSGVIELKNTDDIQISSLKYQNLKNEDVASLDNEIVTKEVLPQNTASVEQLSGRLATDKLLRLEQVQKEGWYILDDTNTNLEVLANKNVYYWDERLSSFQETDGFSLAEDNEKVFFRFFSDEELVPKAVDTTFFNVDSSSIQVENLSFNIEFSISSTDLDENGILNDLEGFNLIRNNSNAPILVKDLIEVIEEEIVNNAIYPYLYLWSNDGRGWNSASILSKNDIIPEQSSFWIKADSLFEETLISFQVNPITDVYEEEKEEPSIRLGFNLESKESQRSIFFNFYEGEEKLKRDVLIPQFNQELRNVETDFILFGALASNSWNSEINLRIVEEQKLIFPLAVLSSESGTFSLKAGGLINLPIDWEILIEDLETGKEYQVDQSLNIEFEFSSAKKEPYSQSEMIQEELISKEIQPRFNVVVIPPGVKEIEIESPEEITLDQNYPNPFNPTTTISFYLPEAIPVKLSVFNIVGQPVSVLTEGTLAAGDHEFEWNATGLPTGMYIYQLEVGNKILTQKMTLVK